jgi:hypothetical protein
MVQVGDIVAIPVDGATHRAEVLFVSSYFLNLILIGLLGRDQPNWPYVALVYTSRESIPNPWPIVGTSGKAPPISLSTRVVAQNVWVGDEQGRVATSVDRDRFPLMRVAGQTAVERIIREVIGKVPTSLVTRKILQQTESLRLALTAT